MKTEQQPLWALEKKLQPSRSGFRDFFRRLINSRPRRMGAEELLQKAEAHLKVENYLRALWLYWKALGRAQSRWLEAQAHLGLARCYCAQTRYDEGRQHYLQALDAARKMPDLNLAVQVSLEISKIPAFSKFGLLG